MKTKPNILVLCQPTESSSFYRAVGPFMHLEKMGVCTVSVTDQISWPNILKADIVFMLRPATPQHVAVAEMVKTFNRPLWIDHDDDILSLPPEHEDAETLRNDSTVDAFVAVARMADAITVTTPGIAKRFARAEIIPNAIDTDTWPIPVTPRTKEQFTPVIAWRGGKTHREDLELVAPHLNTCAAKGIRFLFLGMKPTCAITQMKAGTYSWIQSQGLSGYIQSMQHNRAPVHMVPLKTSEFNQSKSNIAWIEATWFGGSAVLASHVCEEWNYCMPFFNNFPEVALELINNHEARSVLISKSEEIIREKYSLPVTNHKRADIIERLMCRGT